MNQCNVAVRHMHNDVCSLITNEDKMFVYEPKDAKRKSLTVNWRSAAAARLDSHILQQIQQGSCVTLDTLSAGAKRKVICCTRVSVD